MRFTPFALLGALATTVNAERPLPDHCYIFDVVVKDDTDCYFLADKYLSDCMEGDQTKTME